MTVSDEMRAATPCGNTTGHGSCCCKERLCGDCRRLIDWADRIDAEMLEAAWADR